jgi:hypothetical protein
MSLARIGEDVAQNRSMDYPERVKASSAVFAKVGHDEGI